MPQSRPKQHQDHHPDKKKKSKQQQKQRNRQPKRPPPPPPPPKSLIELLRRDPNVLRYFQALQANLEADVQIWKDRAKNWERQLKELQNNDDDNVFATKKQKRQKTAAAADDDDDKDISPTNGDGISNSNNINNNEVDEAKEMRNNTKTSEKTSAASMITTGKKRKAVSKHGPTNKQTVEKKNGDDDEKQWQQYDSGHDDNSDNENETSDANSVSKVHGTQRQSTAASCVNRPEAIFDFESADDDDDDDDDDDNNEQDEIMKNQHELLGVGKHRGIEITDDMLSYPSDSSDSDNDGKEITKVHGKPTPFNGNQSDGDDGKDDCSDDDEGLSLSDKPIKKQKNRVDPGTQKYYDEVLSCLSELNIQIDNDSNAKKFTDEALWTNIRLALETLCRVVSTEDELKEFPPFRDGIPSPDNHPARECLLLVFRTVLLIETFGEYWKGTDLGDRRGTVRIMERELRKEVRYGWAAADRKVRLSQPGAVFINDMGENDDAPVDSTEVSMNSLPKLSLLLERSCLARLLMGLYISRDEIQTAVHVIQEYLLCTIPCRGKEDELYPRLPPTLSFVLLEAMIRPCINQMGWGHKGKQFDKVELWSHLWGEGYSGPTKQIYFASIHHTGSIWRERATSRQDRVRHVAQAELAAYKRLCEECGIEKTCTSFDRSEYEQLMRSLECNLDSHDTMVAYQLCLVLEGSLDLSNMIWSPEQSRDWNLNRFYCWCTAYRHIYLRDLEKAARAVGSKVTLNTPPDSTLQECHDQFMWLWELNPFESNIDKVHVLSTLMKCSTVLSDGSSVILYGKELIDILKSMRVDEHKWQDLRPIWDVYQDVSKRPLVRVINLQRRHDRWKHMMCQAMAQEFLIVRGLGDLRASENSDDVNWMFGGYAFDGQWPRSQLLESLTSPAQMGKLLQTEWRPLELVAFDRDAPRSEKMVSMHSSEVACALSHIACWKACSRTFCLEDPVSSLASPSGLIRQPGSIWQSLHLAGYARGPPLNEKNGSMSPAPVCLVLEDDAHVVDDFFPALELLLNDLPRDFQYCALGYSRPKAAPILVPWVSRPRVGIPSHLFFATGYLVSPAGVAYFQDHAPVQGPIDAWLGLRMTRNFENLVGERLGVGGHGKGGDLSGSQATKIMDFRAFCAVPPLCSQPMRNSNNTGRRWKDKDTDIVYSGHP